MRAGTKGVAGYYFHANLSRLSFSLFLSGRTTFVSDGRLDLAPLHRIFPYRRASSEKTRQSEGKAHEKEYRRIKNQRLTIGSMLADTCFSVCPKCSRQSNESSAHLCLRMLLFFIYTEICPRIPETHSLRVNNVSVSSFIFST